MAGTSFDTPIIHWGRKKYNIHAIKVPAKYLFWEDFLMDKNKKSENITFKQGRKKREELQLPILHFVVSDDWIDKLGHDAFVAWLKFYSWCDRSDERKNKDYDVVPRSFRAIMKELGIGTKKFYNAIIRPLWNYGLIDIEEYEDSAIKGNKPMNIIVYEYPQNDISKKTKALEKIRDYDTDYSSESRKFALTGGRKAKDEKENAGLDGFHTKQGVVSTGKQGWFPHETGGGFTGKPNNDSNSITNVSNGISNDSNNINNLSIENSNNNLYSGADEEKEKKIDRPIDINYLQNKITEKKHLPIPVAKPMMIHTQRLIDEGIDIEDIESMYFANKDVVNDHQFGNILSTVLYETKGTIRNIRALLQTAIKNYFKDINEVQQEKQNVRKEIVPDWFREQQEEKERQKQEEVPYNLEGARDRFSDIFNF